MAFNQLKGADKFRLIKYIDDTRPEGTDSEIAAKASEVLGFHITANNIGGVRTILGIRKKTWTRRPKEKATDLSSLMARVSRLEEFCRGKGML